MEAINRSTSEDVAGRSLVGGGGGGFFEDITDPDVVPDVEAEVDGSTVRVGAPTGCTARIF